VAHTAEKHRLTFSDHLRIRFKGVLDPVAAFFNRMGLMPNTMTILGLIGNVIGAIFLAQGKMTIGGIIILIMGPVDALDGAMARLRGEPSDFGAFVDSVTDRYSELVILGGLLYYFLNTQQEVYAGLVFLATAGSVLVSYVRARAASLGHDTKVGILSRFERYAVLVPTLIFNIPQVGMAIIAVLANVTAIQRIIDVRRQVHATKGKK
jgi:CDP-diacylglycerol---glycerol-3-phosphate 3-phosphatidyltransferase